MSASHPNVTPPTQGQGQSGEPSMEDILASIRRILSEEEGHDAAAAGATPADDVLQLDQTMMVPDPTAAASPPTQPVAAAPTVPEAAVLAEPAPEVQPPPMQSPEAVAEESPAHETGFDAGLAGLVAPEAAAAAAQSVGSLVRTLAAERSMQVHAGGPTIEDIVREEIRPLLKHWLDINLPPMVERLVRVEIERVVGRAVP